MRSIIATTQREQWLGLELAWNWRLHGDVHTNKIPIQLIHHTNSKGPGVRGAGPVIQDPRSWVLRLNCSDWTKHCLKQPRGINEDDSCARYVWRQWQLG